MYTILGTALVVTLFTYVYQVSNKPTSKVPGPWYSKYTSLVLKYHWVKGRRSHYVHDLHQRFGRAVRIAPDEVDFCDITALKEINNVKTVYAKAKWYRQLTGGQDENVFDTMNVDVHRKFRRLLSGAMSESSLRTAVPVVRGRVDLAMKRMKEEMATRGAADVFKWWMFMATDVIGELTFGESFRLLELGKKNEYVQQLESIAPLSAIRSTSPSLAFLADILPIPVFKRASMGVKRLAQYANESLARYEQVSLTDPKRVEHGLFTKLFHAVDEETLSQAEIRTNAGAYIVAGSDTTSNTLTYAVWAICRHPHVQAALTAELRMLPADFGDAELKELPYLGRVIDETLRLYSAAPSGLPRTVPAGGAELCGYSLPGGTIVCAQAYSMHRDGAIFSEPEMFRPERWETPSKAMKDAFVPFGGGSRVCLGMHLARLELRFALTRFFLEFPAAKVATVEGFGEQDMVPKIFFLLSPSGRRCLMSL